MLDNNDTAPQVDVGDVPPPEEGMPVPATAERRRNEAIVAMKPTFRHSLVGGTLACSTAGFDTLEWKDALTAYSDACTDIGSGDLSRASNMLTSQALTLDAVFTELLSRATKNIGQYPEAMERYMRLALKAQAQSRATIEAIVSMHQPREQVVRHVHVYEGGQAVVAEQLHMHGSGARNAGSDQQPYAQSTPVAALPCPDPFGHGVPISGGARESSVPNARRGKGKRRAGRKH